MPNDMHQEREKYLFNKKSIHPKKAALDEADSEIIVVSRFFLFF